MGGSSTLSCTAATPCHTPTPRARGSSVSASWSARSCAIHVSLFRSSARFRVRVLLCALAPADTWSARCPRSVGRLSAVRTLSPDVQLLHFHEGLFVRSSAAHVAGRAARIARPASLRGGLHPVTLLCDRPKDTCQLQCVQLFSRDHGMTTSKLFTCRAGLRSAAAPLWNSDPTCASQ